MSPLPACQLQQMLSTFSFSDEKIKVCKLPFPLAAGSYLSLRYTRVLEILTTWRARALQDPEQSRLITVTWTSQGWTAFPDCYLVPCLTRILRICRCRQPLAGRIAFDSVYYKTQFSRKMHGIPCCLSLIITPKREGSSSSRNIYAVSSPIKFLMALGPEDRVSGVERMWRVEDHSPLTYRDWMREMSIKGSSRSSATLCWPIE